MVANWRFRKAKDHNGSDLLVKERPANSSEEKSPAYSEYLNSGSGVYSYQNRRLSRQKASASEDYSGLSTAIERLERTIEKLTRVIHEQKAQIKELEGEREWLLDSRSWRWTAVLRALILFGYHTKWRLQALFKAAAPSPAPGQDWILMVERRIPMPENNSASFRMFYLMKIFIQRGLRVFFLSESRLEDYSWVVPEPSQLLPYQRRLLDYGVEHVFGRDAAVAHLREHGSRYRYVLLVYPEIAHTYLPLIRTYCPKARIIFDSVDLHFLRIEREGRLKNDPALLEQAGYYRKIETLAIKNSDVTLAISEEEKKIIESMVPGMNVTVQQNIYEPPSVTCALPFKLRRNLLFIGHYLHTPNVDAVKYFVSEIFPLVRQEIQDAEFLVVGSNITDEIAGISAPGVRIVGFVEDPAALFNQCRVSIAPLRYGAGVKGKIGQSMSFGLPVVTTSIGAEGMALTNGETALIEDRPAEFARAIVKLYQDEQLWNRLREGSMRHIQSLMGYERASERMNKVLDELGEQC